MTGIPDFLRRDADNRAPWMEQKRDCTQWLLALNPDPHPRPLPPEALEGATWALALDTAACAPAGPAEALAPRAVRLLRRVAAS